MMFIVEGIGRSALMLILISNVEVDVASTIAEACCYAVDVAKVDVVSIGAIVVRRAGGEEVEVCIVFEG